MNKPIEQLITEAQTKAQLPEIVRRGRSVTEYISEVVRRLNNLGHRVTKIGLTEYDSTALKAHASVQPGQMLGDVCGFQHDEIGYIPVAVDAPLHGHVTFQVPGFNLPGGHDFVALHATPEEGVAQTEKRFTAFKDGFPVPAIVPVASPTAAAPEGDPDDKQPTPTDANPELIARANAAGVLVEPGDIASDVLTKLGENAYATGGTLPAGIAPAIVGDDGPPEGFIPKGTTAPTQEKIQADELARTETEDGQALTRNPADTGTAEANVPASQSVNPDAANAGTSETPGATNTTNPAAA